MPMTVQVGETREQLISPHPIALQPGDAFRANQNKPKQTLFFLNKNKFLL